MSSAEALPDRAVVVGIDGSGPAHNALMWAAREAAERQLPLVVCHAYQSAPAEPDWEIDNARRNRAQRQAMEDVRTKPHWRYPGSRRSHGWRRDRSPKYWSTRSPTPNCSYSAAIEGVEARTRSPTYCWTRSSKPALPGPW